MPSNHRQNSKNLNYFKILKLPQYKKDIKNSKNIKLIITYSPQ
jgi:hypothetical protein